MSEPVASAPGMSGWTAGCAGWKRRVPWPARRFVTGWSYWVRWVVTGAEISAAGIYVKDLFPDIPQWVTAAVVLLAC